MDLIHTKLDRNAPARQAKSRYAASITGADGSIYGIPYRATRVARFDASLKVLESIGPILEYKYNVGVMALNGIIYCLPCARDITNLVATSECHILKIDTLKGKVSTVRDRMNLANGNKHKSGSLGLDGCIYFMPWNYHYILKLDPKTDTFERVGDLVYFRNCCFGGTVTGLDGCIYGIPDNGKRIVKYDPDKNIMSFFGGEAEVDLRCGGGAVGRNGNIYAANVKGQVLKIDIEQGGYCFIGSPLRPDMGDGIIDRNPFRDSQIVRGLGDAIMGGDGCIYWPTKENNVRVLKFDPVLEDRCMIGEDLGQTSVSFARGALAPNGSIYCLPYDGFHVLSIDPLKEFTWMLYDNKEEHPGKFGFLFERKSIAKTIFHPTRGLRITPKKQTIILQGSTMFESAVTKFGRARTFEVMAKCGMSPTDICTITNLYPFLMAASNPGHSVSVIYEFLRRDPSVLLCTCSELLSRSLLEMKNEGCEPSCAKCSCALM